MRSHFLGFATAVLLQSQYESTYALPKPANATVESTKYFSDNSSYKFIDVKGTLSDIISEYSFEVIVSGLGFGEGPKWIQDCDYVNNGYVLIPDQYSDCIWRYYAMNNSDSDSGDVSYQLECIKYFEDGEGSGPNAVGWNLNFPDEIYVAFQGSSEVKRLNLTADGIPELNSWNASNEDVAILYVNDIILDSQGNAYFTTYPWNSGDPRLNENTTAGVWSIPRSTMEVELLEQLHWGANGIAMTLDETTMVAAMTVDFPPGVYNSGDPNQVNLSNYYWRGYENAGSISTSNDFNDNNAFMYLRADNAPDYFTNVSVSDSSAFDFDNNYWQTIIFGDTAEGYILIADALTYDADDSAMIGIVNFTGTGYGPTNLAKGMDGYMYVTLTQWNGDCTAGQPGWGCGGILGRIPLVNYYTSDGSNDYVLDCTGDDGMADDTSDTDAGFRCARVTIATYMFVTYLVAFVSCIM